MVDDVLAVYDHCVAVNKQQITNHNIVNRMREDVLAVFDDMVSEERCVHQKKAVKKKKKSKSSNKSAKKSKSKAKSKLVNDWMRNCVRPYDLNHAFCRRDDSDSRLASATTASDLVRVVSQLATR
eukprot:CAMPEP_0202691764 /NCGR_PEP_ID=MMETSP1385-20130828/6388_1 /ASSEMBLY_ACC=CAM_ASM_000861 /TAXON_ID=933848 /ORGANISM="Elphidium margaritaceum" /LENGTH=124 /DNA_ID=CAMNT_0049347213 /DNA_START=149 /DNA_END=523 /DNA_ORIENTATION=-